jgi:hypothetical protein
MYDQKLGGKWQNPERECQESGIKNLESEITGRVLLAKPQDLG